MTIFSMRKLLLALTCLLMPLATNIPGASADQTSIRQKCTALRSQTEAAKGQLSGGEAVVTTALTGLVGLAVTAAVKADQGDKAGREAEDRCLAQNGMRANCACPQMTQCKGSWKMMTCEALTDLCRNTPSTKVFEANRCKELKRLVKY